MQNKKYFCYELYKNLAIWSFNGEIRYTPCSYSTYTIATSESIDMSKVWNSEEHQRLQNYIQQDLPVPGCESCYHEESHGLKSRRLNVIDLYETYFQDNSLCMDSPQSIDYSVGNLCNLKCTICKPENSTAWAADFIKIYPKNANQIAKFDKFNQIQLTDIGYLQNLTNIHFHGGGEPLLSDAHINLLNSIKNVKGLSDVHVLYNTNGTKLANKSLLELWSECRLVELYFSIDDIGERFEYQRTGATWDDLIENIQWFTENMPVNHMFKINCTWSLLNIYYLDELVNWYENNFKSNRLGDPVDLIFQKASGITSVTHLSSSSKQIILDKYKNYPTLQEIVKSIPEDNTPHTEFIEYIDKLDSIRTTDYPILFNDFFLLLNR